VWSAGYSASLYIHDQNDKVDTYTTNGKIWMDKPSNSLRIDTEYPKELEPPMPTTMSFVLKDKDFIGFFVASSKGIDLCQYNATKLPISPFDYPMFNWTFNSTAKGCNWFTSGIVVPDVEDFNADGVTFSYCLKSDGTPVYLNITAGTEGHLSVCMHDVSTSKIKASIFGLPPKMTCTKLQSKWKRSFESVKNALFSF